MSVPTARYSPRQLCAAGASPEELWEVLAEGGYRPHAIGQHGELRPIPDTYAFTARLPGPYTNIWAVHRTQAQPDAAWRPAPRYGAGATTSSMKLPGTMLGLGLG